MKYMNKKQITYGICIILTISFIGFKAYTGRNKSTQMGTSVSDTQKDTAVKDTSDTKSTDELKAAASSSGNVSSFNETKNIDITMDGTTPNTDGNSSGNLLYNGYFAKQGKWIYFTLPVMNLKSYPIYRVMEDGETGLKALTKPGSKACINVIGNWIYYLDGYHSDSPSINRTKTDGTITEQVLKGPIYDMHIKDGYIYYISNDGENNCIYKFKLDASNVDKGELIATAPKNANFNHIYVTDNNIYTTIVKSQEINYIDSFFSNFYSMNLNGTNLKKISDDNLYSCIIYNNYIYYLKTDDQRLYRMNLNGTKRMQLFTAPIFSFNVYNDNIYFSEGTGTGNQNNIFKSNLDGKNIIKLTHNSYSNNIAEETTSVDSIQDIYCIDDSVFYLGYSNITSYPSLLSVKNDGSLEKKIN